LIPSGLKAITLDLDDTLWPIEPAIAKAELALHAWFAQHAPAVAARYDVPALRTLRDQVAREHPQWGHDFTRIRMHSLERALQSCACDPGLAPAAFEAFFVARHQLELYDEAHEALRRLAARYPLLALTNGNADLALAGVGDYFVGVVSARGFGVGKPDCRIFEEACRRLDAAPHELLHVGDDWALDVEGARGAGLHAAWLCRDATRAPPTPEVWVVRHLGELCSGLRVAVTN
jgi:putative hydrolase of the HAD superfamily